MTFFVKLFPTSQNGEKSKSSRLQHVSQGFSMDFRERQTGSQRHQESINHNLYYWLPENFDPTQSGTESLENIAIWSLLNMVNFAVTSHLEDMSFYSSKNRTQQVKHKPYFSLLSKNLILLPLFKFHNMNGKYSQGSGRKAVRCAHIQTSCSFQKLLVLCTCPFTLKNM